MIAKGTTHNNGAKLASYMETSKDGERAELWELRGFAATNIKDAFRCVDAMAGATKAEQPFFHVQVRNREGETLTRQQYEYAADRIERMLGLSGQPRAITFHTYEHNGDEHMHVAWSRIDQDTLTAKHLPFFKERLKKISRELELHFGLEPVTNHREGHIKFAPTKAQEEQARRLGLDIHEVRNTIRDCWDRSDNGRSFQAALEDEGLILAQGERRDFVVIDQGGGIHALGKRILDMTAAKMRDRVSDLSRDELPTVDNARALVSEYRTSSKQEKVASVWDRDRDDRIWQDAVINAAIEKEKTDRQFVNPGTEETRAVDRQAVTGGAEKHPPIMPPTPDLTKRGAEYPFRGAANEAVRPPQTGAGERAEQRFEGSRATSPERADNIRNRSRVIASDNIKRPAAVGKVAMRTIAKTLDVVSDAFESLLAPKLTPEQIREGENATFRREADAEKAVDFSKYTAELAQRRQQQEIEQEAERQRHREGGGRER